MMITRLLAILLAAAVVAPAAADPVLLKVGFPSPPMSWTNTHGMTPWAQSVEKAADGLVEIKIFPGGSVANFRNVYDRVINGVVDIGFGPTGDISDQSPRSDVSSLPFEVRNASEASLALWRLFAKGELAADYKAVKPVSLFALPTTTLHSSKPIRALADMRGMRLIVLSRLLGQAISTVDGTPLTMTAAEAYQSIDRGVADGAAIAWAGVAVFKLQEVAKYHLEIPLGAAPATFFMNRESYARLPDKAKRAIDENSGERLSRTLGEAADANDRESRERLSTVPGQTVTILEAREAGAWRDRLKPIAEEWARTAPDGAKVLAAFRAELASIRGGK